MSIASALHELTNEPYRVCISDAGGGQSCWKGIALTRWLNDPVEDAHGFFIYLRDADTGALWSAGLQPTARAPDRYEVQRALKHFVIEREDFGITSVMSVSVQDDVEVRRLRLCNRSNQVRRIEVTSYLEIALVQPNVDLSHPAFAKLFVQTEIAGPGVLVAQRRPRASDESWPTMFHSLHGAPVERWETDRLQFIGRGRSPARPAMEMRGTVGNVLDPIFSLSTTLTLPPGTTRELTFSLGVVADASRLQVLSEPNAAVSAPTHRPSAHRARGTNLRSGFNDDGSEYVIELPWIGDALELPPMPWVNIIANEHFGFIVSETGAGCTWSRNSQANRLTPWSNDPVCDPHGEAFYIRDEDTGEFWSPMPGPVAAAVQHQARHGFGYSCFDSISQEVEQHVTMFVAQNDPVKIVRIRITNRAVRPRRLSLFGYQQLVMGTMPEFPSGIRTWILDGVVCARNDKAADFLGGIAFSFAVVSGTASEHVCCDRQIFIGINRSVRSPAALHQPVLDEACGADLDPCFARQVQFTLEAGNSFECDFVFGEALGEDELCSLIARYRDTQAIPQAFDDVVAFWKEHLGGVRVQTPSPEIDRMINGWLPYQALASRIWGRTAFYQCSGAFGFRDQLQDAGNVCLLWPDLTRKQILQHARHQFNEGDVLHWWHDAPINRGVRTRFSDDRLWLPYVTNYYVESTGDDSVLDEIVPFLRASVLAAGEAERFLKPEVCDEAASLYEHCCQALDISLTRGVHGLPLMGSGDWNDGMNRVGREGRGESVWLGFFLCRILAAFIPVARDRSDPARAERYMQYRESLLLALNDAGWDGDWYRRAYYDDGTPLGTKEASECQIDGLAQAWSVLSDAAPCERAQRAMTAVEEQLVNESDGLVRLLTPPFVDTLEDPGYIKGYVAGVRENGGQYTHAACWIVEALTKLGRRNRALCLLKMLSPAWHTRSADEVERYKVEPYVIAADVYGAEPHVGRGGWTWYTGSAGLAYRVTIESVLGLSIERGRTLVLRPCVPDDWLGYRIEYQQPGSQTSYVIEVRNPDGCSECVTDVELDGERIPVSDGTARLPIMGDGALHHAVVTLGHKPL